MKKGNNDRKAPNSKLLLKSETMKLLVHANLSWVAGGVITGTSSGDTGCDTIPTNS